MQKRAGMQKKQAIDHGGKCSHVIYCRQFISAESQKCQLNYSVSDLDTKLVQVSSINVYT